MNDEMIEMAPQPSPASVATNAATSEAAQAIPPEVRRFVAEWQERVRTGRSKHKKAFDRMREDMRVAYTGSSKPGWAEGGKYVANIIQRHVSQRVATLYAKNPKVVSRPRKRLNYAVWDGNAESLKMATMAIMTAAQTGQSPDPTAVAMMADFQKGFAAAENIRKVGETLEVLFAYYLQEQQPTFKKSMKKLVRRACTTGVGWVKVGFQREMARTPEAMRALADMQAQITFIEASNTLLNDPNRPRDAEDPRIEEIRVAMRALEQEPMAIVRQGLVYSFPKATAIIPDPATIQLDGFLGGRWVAEEMFMTVEQVLQTYKVNLAATDFTPYSGVKTPEGSDARGASPTGDWKDGGSSKAALVCVWEVYDRATGTQFTIADGYPGYLDDPSTPSVRVEGLFPFYSLTFNDCESDDELYPLSDVQLIKALQDDYNDSRQGLREHRTAARPKTVSPKGALSEEDKATLGSMRPHYHVELAGLAPGQKVSDLFQPIPYPGVDPNLYETGPIMNDILLTVGSQEATMGSTSGATATEVATAEASRSATSASNVDDLDDFLSDITRAGGQVLLMEMDADEVMKIVGPGAVWPELSREQIASEVFLEVQAGSSGRPNKAVEVQNFQTLAPILMQIPGISPEWLAKEAIRRMDDRLDINDAIVPGLMSIAAQNQMAGGAGAAGGPQDMAAAPGEEPSAQGAQGADRVPRADTPQAGSSAPMGGNNLRAVG